MRSKRIFFLSFFSISQNQLKNNPNLLEWFMRLFYKLNSHLEYLPFKFEFTATSKENEWAKENCCDS